MQKAKLSPHEFISLLEKLLNDKIPTEDLKALGGAIVSLKLEDWKSIGGNIFTKDLKPLYLNSKKNVVSFKDLKKTVKEEGAKSFLKTIAKKSSDKIKSTLDTATVSIPEAKSRLGRFTKKIATDYSHLKSNEERGNYILKLSLYSGIFALAFQQGAKQKMFSKSTIPLIALGMSLILINRLLEQTESNLEENSGALNLSKNLRSLLKTLNSGFTSGMTLNVMVSGITEQNIKISDAEGKTLGSLMPKSLIDNMIYSTLLGLFSNEAT